MASSAKGYGFTLLIWTTAALVISRHGVPNAAEAFAFMGGALVGMASIVTAACGGWRANWSDIGLVRRAFGAVHLVSVLAGVLVGWLAARALGGVLAFGVAAFCAVVVYELLLALELQPSTVADRPRAVADGDGVRR